MPNLLSPPNPADAAAQPDYRPTTQHLDTPEKLMMVFKQVLDQHYALRDAHAETLRQLHQLRAQVNAPQPRFPRGSGPTDTIVLGLPVQPIDTQQLADGAALKFEKATGSLKFS